MIEIRALGRLELFLDGRPHQVTIKKEQALLVYLACHEGEFLRRETLADLLWGSALPGRGRRSLSQAIYRIRKYIPELPLETDREEVRLLPGGVRLDVQSFKAAIEREEFAAALELYRGQFLDDLWIDGAHNFELWQLSQRAELERLALKAARSLVFESSRSGEWEEVIKYTDLILRLDPFDQSALRIRIRAIAVARGRERALSEYNRLVSQLELWSIDPDMETRALIARLSEGQPVQQDYPEAPIEEPTPFFGRRNEQRELLGEWQLVRSGVTRGVVISGEPGIGKTRFCEQLLLEFSIQGARIFRAQCSVTDKHVPYSALVDSVMSELRTKDLDALQPEWLGLLSTVLPEVGSVKSIPHLPGPLEGEGGRRLLFEIFVHLFKGASAYSPIVIFIDDFQWCDRVSSDFIHYAFRRFSSSPILILLCTRPEGITSKFPPETLDTWELYGTGYRHLVLEPLSYYEAERLLGSYAEKTPLPLTVQQRAELYSLVGGRPFFLLEIARALSEGDIDWTGERPSASELLSPSLDAFLNGMIRRLDKDAHAILAVLATFGSGTELDLIEELAGLDRERLLRGIEELVDRGLITEEAEEIRFAHGLVRESAYRSIGRVRRMTLREAASRLREKSRDTGVASRRERESLFGLAPLPRALEIAEDLLLSFLEEGGYPWESINDQYTVEGSGVGYVTLVNALGHIRVLPERLVSFLPLLMGAAAESGQYGLLLDLARFELFFASTIGDSVLVGAAITRLDSLAEEVESDAQRSIILASIAKAALPYHGVARANLYADEAVRLAHQIGRGPPLSMALRARARIRTSSGELAGAGRDLDRILALDSRESGVIEEQSLFEIQSDLLRLRGCYDEARRIVNEGLEFSHRTGNPLLITTQLANLLILEHELGNSERATNLAGELLAYSEAPHFIRQVSLARAVLGLEALEVGALRDAARYHDEIVITTAGRDFDPESVSYRDRLYARIAATGGELERVVEWLDEKINAYRIHDIVTAYRLELELSRLILDSSPAEATRRANTIYMRSREIGAMALAHEAKEILDRSHGT